MYNWFIEKLSDLDFVKAFIMVLAGFAFAWLAPFGVGELPQSAAAFLAALIIFLLL